MANKTKNPKRGNNDNNKRKGVPIWFFIEGQLHKRLKVDRSNDLLLCWNFKLGKRVVYTLSSAKLRMRPCFSTRQAASMLNRYNFTLLRHVEAGAIPPPSVAVWPNEVRAQTTRWRWSEDDVMAMRDHLATMRSSSDFYNLAEDPMPNKEVPSRRELRAMMNNEETLYIRDSTGEFTPTWRSKDF